MQISVHRQLVGKRRQAEGKSYLDNIEKNNIVYKYNLIQQNKQ